MLVISQVGESLVKQKLQRMRDEKRRNGKATLYMMDRGSRERHQTCAKMCSFCAEVRAVGRTLLASLSPSPWSRARPRGVRGGTVL